MGFGVFDDGEYARQVIELLLREGADINVGHRIDGWTALHLATQQASIAAVQLLLDEGANVALTNNAGDTALHTATQGGSNQAPAIVHMLLQAGANPNAMSGVSGESPVHVAARSFSTNILRMLIRCKGSVEQVDRMGATPLLTALEARCVHGAHFLLHHCASLDVRDIVHGKTPIQRARALGFADMATLFEEIAAQRSEQKQLAQLIVAKVRPQQAVDIPSFLWRRIFGGGSENEQRGAFLPIRQSWLRQSDRGGAEPSRATRIAQAIEREVETNVRNLRGMIERRVMVKWADGRWCVGMVFWQRTALSRFPLRWHGTELKDALRCRYRGRITDFDVKSMQSRVLYDDGDSKRCVVAMRWLLKVFLPWKDCLYLRRSCTCWSGITFQEKNSLNCWRLKMRRYVCFLG